MNTVFTWLKSLIGGTQSDQSISPDSIIILVDRDVSFGLLGDGTEDIRHFRDALIINENDFPNLSFSDIKSMEDDRVNTWVDQIQNPITTDSPQEEE